MSAALDHGQVEGSSMFTNLRASPSHFRLRLDCWRWRRYVGDPELGVKRKRVCFFGGVSDVVAMVAITANFVYGECTEIRQTNTTLEFWVLGRVHISHLE